MGLGELRLPPTSQAAVAGLASLVGIACRRIQAMLSLSLAACCRLSLTSLGALRPKIEIGNVADLETRGCAECIFVCSYRVFLIRESVENSSSRNFLSEARACP